MQMEESKLQENQRFLMNMLSGETSLGSFLDSVWKQREQEQLKVNEERRAKYDLPEATGKWSPRHNGPVAANPPLTAVKDTKIQQLRK